MSSPPSNRPVRVAAVLKRAFQNIRAPFWLLVGLAFLTLLLEAPGSIAGLVLGDASAAAAFGLQTIFLLYAFLVLAPFSTGLAWAHLRVSRSKTPKFGDWLEGWRIWPQAVGTAVLAWLAVMAGLLLLILPGIYVAVRLTFTTYALLDERQGPVAALRRSWELTRGRFWSLFGLGILSFLIVLAGLLVLVLGVLVSITWIGQAVAVYYQALVGEHDGPGTPAESAPTAVSPVA